MYNFYNYNHTQHCDKNGCKNIQKVFNHYIETGERPEKYKRDYKFQ